MVLRYQAYPYKRYRPSLAQNCQRYLHRLHLPNMTTLDVRKIGPFRVKHRVGNAAFELELPSHIKVHLIVSCVYIESAQPAPFKHPPPPPPIEVVGEERCCDIVLGDVVLGNFRTGVYGGLRVPGGTLVCLEVPRCAWRYLGVPGGT